MTQRYGGSMEVPIHPGHLTAHIMRQLSHFNLCMPKVLHANPSNRNPGPRHYSR